MSVSEHVRSPGPNRKDICHTIEIKLALVLVLLLYMLCRCISQMSTRPRKPIAYRYGPIYFQRCTYLRVNNVHSFQCQTKVIKILGQTVQLTLGYNNGQAALNNVENE